MSPKKTILVVDDEDIARDVAVIALESEYNVLTAVSAEDMQIKLEERIPDLILLDLYMPGANGFEALFSISTSRKWCKIPVIFVTSESDTDIEKEALSCGVFAYIKKPYSAEHLRKSVAVVFAIAKHQENSAENAVTEGAKDTNAEVEGDKISDYLRSGISKGAEYLKSDEISKTLDATSKKASDKLEALSERKDYVISKCKNAKSSLFKIFNKKSETEK